MVELHQDKVMIGWPSFLAAISAIHPARSGHAISRKKSHSLNSIESLVL